MKLHDFNLRVLQIVNIIFVVLYSCSLSQSQEESSWFNLEKELLSHPLQQSFDPQMVLDKYKKIISVSRVDDLIKLAGEETNKENKLRGQFILKFAQYVAHKLDDKRMEGICFSKLGEFAFANDEHDLAVEYYTKGRELLIQSQAPEVVLLLLDFSGLQYSFEKYIDAKAKAEEGLRLIEQHRSSEFLKNNPSLEANLQLLLGEIAIKNGQYPEAEAMLKTVISYYEKKGKPGTLDLVSYCEALQELGKSYRAMGQYNQALFYFNEALLKGKDSPDEAFYPSNLNSIGILYMEQRDYETARKYLMQSLELFEKRKFTFEQADVFLHLGVINLRIEQPSQAIRYLNKSYELYKKYNSQEGIIAAGNALGHAYRIAGSFTEAAGWYNKSLLLAEQQQNTIRLAEIYWQICELNLDKQDWSSAIQAGQKALSFNHTQSNPNLFYLVNTALGRAYMKNGDYKNDDYKNGEKYLNAAIQSIEEARGKVSGNEESLQLFFVDKVAAYRSLIDSLVSQKRYEEALLVSEKAKARVLYDSFRQQPISSSKEKPQEIKFIQTKTPSLKENEIQSLVDVNTVFITYVIGNEKIYLFVLTNNNQVPIQVLPLQITSGELEKRVAGFSREVASHGFLFVNEAKNLYELLIEPAKDSLTNCQRVVVVPDGFLWNLPFQALMDKDGKYLLEKHEVSYTPSLAVAIEIRKKEEQKQASGKESSGRESQNELLAIGNPIQSKSPLSDLVSFSDLPEAEDEVRSLSKIYGQSSKIFLRDKATKAAIKSLFTNFRILHFATHGILYKEHPLSSALVLAKPISAKNASNEDGLLKAEEIINLPLSADLVVLSACESGQGEITNGEGMVGLSWAFMYAGASNIVASQWKVDSLSTSKLMVDFHRELSKQSGNQKSASALRQAALRLKESEAYKHPFYWASFVVIGSGN